MFTTSSDRPSSQLEVWGLDTGTNEPFWVALPTGLLISIAELNLADADRPTWRCLGVSGSGPSPRSSHVAVSLQPTPLELLLFPSLVSSSKLPACEDVSRPGYWHVMPSGFGGPYSPKHMQLNVHDGCVFDPTPEVESELKFHAKCRRVVVFGGLSSVGTYLPMDEVFHFCLEPTQFHRPVLPELVVASPTHVMKSQLGRTSKPTRAGDGVQSWAPLSMSPIKVSRSVMVCLGCSRYCFVES